MALPSKVGTSVSANDNSVSGIEGTLDLAVTIDASAEILVVCVGMQESNRTPSSVTIDFTGTPALTKLVDSQYTTSGNGNYSSIWYITSADANWATGSHTISVTPSGYTVSCQIHAEQYQNVDTATPFSASAAADWGGSTSTAADVDITSATDELIISAGSWYNVDFSAQTGTQIFYQDNGSSAQSMASQSETGTAGTNTVGWTMNSATQWAVCAGSLQDGGAVSAAIGIATETDSALTIADGSPVSAAIGIASETDSALAMTDGSPVSAAIGIASETDSALAITATAQFTDYFTGTGAFEGWDVLNSSSVPNAQRQSGQYHSGTISAVGTTTWFHGDRGRADWKLVAFPGSGTTEFVFENVGVGPSTNAADDLAFGGSTQYAFCGVICHDEDTSAADYEFLVIGHRGAQAESTLENKRTVNNNSTNIVDEGDNAIGTGVTHGDIRLRIHSDQTIDWAYRAVGDTAWIQTQAATGHPGQPATGDITWSSGNVRIGLIAYAYNTVTTSFIGTCDSAIQVGELASVSEAIGIATETDTALNMIDGSPISQQIGIAFDEGYGLPITIPGITGEDRMIIGSLNKNVTKQITRSVIA